MGGKSKGLRVGDFVKFEIKRNIPVDMRKGRMYIIWWVEDAPESVVIVPAFLLCKVADSIILNVFEYKFMQHVFKKC